jgi:membrane fusion protein, heavy metal efflux system
MKIRRTSLFVLAAAVMAIVIAKTWKTYAAPQIAAPAVPGMSRKAGILRYPAGAPQLAEIRSALPVVATLPLSEPLNARLAYDESVTARVSSPLAGRVISLPADIGDHVAMGSVLLVLDSPDLGSAIADAQKSAAELHRKQKAFERSKTLYAGEVLALKDLEDAEADWKQARAEYERTNLRLANLHITHEGQGEKFSLAAPIAGVVTERNANPGTEINPATSAPLFVISDPRRLWAMIDLPEHLLDKVKPGQAVALEAQAWNDVSFPATVARVSPALDPATRRVPVRVVVPNPDGRLKPEMFVRVRLLSDSFAKALRVPSAAVITRRGRI